MPSPSPANRFAPLLVRLAGLWLLAGAAAKLFLGTPKDLPEIVRGLSPFDPDLSFRLIIGVELAIVSLALARPRLAWPVVLALFAFFDFILVKQLLAGAESCGCFGATIKVSPWVMLAVDSTLLAGLLLARPWRGIRGGLPLAVPAIVAAVGLVLPWVAIPSSDGGGAQPARYALMDPASWVDRVIYDVPEITRFVPAEQIPSDGRIVLWRASCSVCAAHLRRLAGENDLSMPVVLVQIRDDLGQTPAVDALPEGPNVLRFELPENLQVVVTTPWDVVVTGGVVASAVHEEPAK